MMLKLQAEALYLASELENGAFAPNVLQNETRLRKNAAEELRRLHARIQEFAVQQFAPNVWRIDKSAGRDILVYNDCSVIEDEQAHYLMRLISVHPTLSPHEDE